MLKKWRRRESNPRFGCTAQPSQEAQNRPVLFVASPTGQIVGITPSRLRELRRRGQVA